MDTDEIGEIIKHIGCIARGFSDESCPNICKRTVARTKQLDKNPLTLFEYTTAIYPHLTDEEIADFIVDSLPPEHASKVILHLGGCLPCAQLVQYAKDTWEIFEMLRRKYREACGEE